MTRSVIGVGKCENTLGVGDDPDFPTRPASRSTLPTKGREVSVAEGLPQYSPSGTQGLSRR
jgi:hypothetical protein